MGYMFWYILGVLVGVIVCFGINDKAWKSDAIEAGAGQYNSVTGEFEWKGTK